MAARIGLTGGIGSGKSTVAALFAGHGVPVIDADQVARDVCAPGGPALGAIREKFGDSILSDDGTLDRAALGRRVFADPGERQWLEELLHPLIRERMDAMAAASDAPFCILEIPLLVESGRDRDMDRVVVVHCPREERIRRLETSRGMSRDEVLRIMAQQASDEERMVAADHVIRNDADAGTLAARVGDVFLALKEAFG